MSNDTWKNRMKDRSIEDRLEPLESLDLGAVQDFDQLLQAMSHTAFGGRRLGEAAEVLEAMVTDPDCAVVMTLSGAMTVAKMGLVITEMIERGWVQAVVSTGALMTHGLVEQTGRSHFKARADLPDEELFKRGYNRVYDTYELESNLNELGNQLSAEVFPRMARYPSFGSRELLAEMGEWLSARGRGPIGAAWEQGVPVYIPAFTDSEMALDLAAYFIAQEASGEDLLTRCPQRFNPFQDLFSYARLIRDAPRLGIFTIGGGVPRNWAQQGPPFLDYLSTKMEEEIPLNRFRYAVRLCPEPAHWGGLSGCSYSEGVSWGKFISPAEGGRYAEVHADATTVWPLLIKAVIQRLEKRSQTP